MVAVELVIELTAKLMEARAAIALDFAPAQDLRHRSGRLPPPDLELEQPVLRGRIALREKQVGFVLRVDVIEAPPIADDLDRLREPDDLYRGVTLRPGWQTRRDDRSENTTKHITRASSASGIEAFAVALTHADLAP